ncbi:MAG TPA: capsid cement protein [Plantibacter sp.]|uniref:capsid cement protein n=1 Tax=Plantibacter sp. TaxID=1871045 RepID=UPI002C8E1A6C|nr:capsid cement protein [Plantibacter sp.]
MAEQIARFKPGENVPVFAQTQILAGRFVQVTGKDTRGAYNGNHAPAGSSAFGVSERDSAPSTYPAHSIDRMVNVVRRGAVAMVEAGAAIPAGTIVSSDANGRAVAYVPPNTTAAGAAVATTPVALGRTITAAAGLGSIIEVDLY